MNAIEHPFESIDRIAPPVDGELHVWRFPLVARPLHCLSESERERARRYAVERPRQQFIAARGILRELLAAYLNCEPADVPLGVEPDGKPVLANARLHFNVTHSGERGLIAVANRRVGVDLEAVRPMPNAAGLVERFFGPEEREQFSALPDDLKLAGFFRGWTCKEALLKAVGTGIQNVNKCVVDLDPRRPTKIIRFDHVAERGSWRLAAWEPEAGYAAALAIEAEAAIEWL